MVKPDAINPSRYRTGSIEVIEAIEDWDLGFHLGNACKYNARAGKKDPTKFVEDLEKAIGYLKRRIELHQAKAEGRKPKRAIETLNAPTPSFSATGASISNASEAPTDTAPTAGPDKYTLIRFTPGGPVSVEPGWLPYSHFQSVGGVLCVSSVTYVQQVAANYVNDGRL